MMRAREENRGQNRFLEVSNSCGTWPAAAGGKDHRKAAAEPQIALLRRGSGAGMESLGKGAGAITGGSEYRIQTARTGGRRAQQNCYGPRTACRAHGVHG